MKGEEERKVDERRETLFIYFIQKREAELLKAVLMLMLMLIFWMATVAASTSLVDMI